MNIPQFFSGVISGIRAHLTSQLSAVEASGREDGRAYMQKYLLGFTQGAAEEFSATQQRFLGVDPISAPVVPIVAIAKGSKRR